MAKIFSEHSDRWFLKSFSLEGFGRKKVEKVVQSDAKYIEMKNIESKQGDELENKQTVTNEKPELKN